MDGPETQGAGQIRAPSPGPQLVGQRPVGHEAEAVAVWPRRGRYWPAASAALPERWEGLGNLSRNTAGMVSRLV